VNIATMSLAVLRTAIRRNQISFPSQVPVFLRQPKADVQWRLVELFFVHNWSWTDLGLRYGISAEYTRKLIARWVRRAAELQYLQEIPRIPIEPIPQNPAEPSIEEAQVWPAARRTLAALHSPPSAELRNYSFGRIKIDLHLHTITVGKRKVELTRNEWAILAKLVSEANRTVSRSELATSLGGTPLDPRGAVRRHIKSLRQKLETDSTNPQYLITKRAIGYQLKIR
jgi:Transcriptional regulatory protein, C terminal